MGNNYIEYFFVNSENLRKLNSWKNSLFDKKKSYNHSVIQTPQSNPHRYNKQDLTLCKLRHYIIKLL